MGLLAPEVAAAIGEGSVAALNSALPPGCDLRAWHTLSTSTGQYVQRSLLHVAAQHSAVDIVVALLAAGCDVNAAAPGDAYTPLHCACERATSSSSARTIAALIRAGADREARCALGRTPCELLAVDTHHVSSLVATDALPTDGQHVMAGSTARSADQTRSGAAA